MVTAMVAGCEVGGPAAPTYAGHRIDSTSAIRFISPIDATPNATVFLGAYVDHASDKGRLDYTCDTKTYDGHRGTDLLLRNLTVQDSGVRVVAAAAGRVTRVEDGFSDRNTTSGFGGFGNHVVVEHGPRLETIYAHLRRQSVSVAVGDEVIPGQTLGLVGSSGNSNWPHLHFEVRDAGSSHDPYAGPCNGDPGRWREQEAYQDSVMILDAGVTLADVSSLRALLERPAPVDTIRGDETAMTVWVQLLNVSRSVLRFELTDPAGVVRERIEQQFSGTFSIWYATLTLPVAGRLVTDGTWIVRFFLAERPVWTGSVWVAGTPGVAPMIAPDGVAEPELHIWNPRPGEEGDPHRTPSE